MLAPENGWLEEDCFLLKRGCFSGDIRLFCGGVCIYVYILEAAKVPTKTELLWGLAEVVFSSFHLPFLPYGSEKWVGWCIE